MKFNINSYAVVALLGALLLGGCKDDNFVEGGVHIPAINSANLAPATDASGTKKAYVGTEVSVDGFNLDRLTAVTVDDLPAQITSQTIKDLKFRIPALEFAQRDLPYEVRIKAYGEDAEPFFTYAYYVTIPVTDAIVTAYAPAEGTVGDEITVSGRNLEQITRIRFGQTVIEAAAFTEVKEGPTDGYVKFLVPAGQYAAADSDVAITAEWGTSTIDVTGENLFALHVPVFEPLAAQPGGENSKIGDEIGLTGENLDLIAAVKWGDVALTIAEQSATDMKVRFPATIEKADPVVQTKALTAEWGAPVQVAALAAAWRLDTTPSSTVLVPAMTSMTAQDGGADNKFYLGKTVTVEGENLTAVEGIELRYNDGEEHRVAAAIAEGATDVRLEFTVPDGVTFTEASEVGVAALYNGGDAADFGKATVCPFYYYKGIRLGLGSNSKSTYTEYAAANAFFSPDKGRVYSTAEWVSEAVDPNVLAAGGNPYVKANNTLSGATPEQYYAVNPYVFFITNSSHKLSLAGCANSASQIKTHCTGASGDWTSLPSTWGTPVVTYRVLTSASDADPVRNGTLTSMAYDSTMPTAGAPALGAAETSSAWVKGSVLVMAYVNQACGKVPSAVTDFAKTGYVVIRDITCANPDGTAKADRTGYIEFDMYWSKMQNE